MNALYDGVVEPNLSARDVRNGVILGLERAQLQGPLYLDEPTSQV
jgi:hypothetical protein